MAHESTSSTGLKAARARQDSWSRSFRRVDVRSRSALCRCAAAAIAAVVVSATAAPVDVPVYAQSCSLPSPAASGVDHIVLIMMENRSFDHFLGWLPGADATQTETYTDSGGTSYSTFHLTSLTAGADNDPCHNYSCQHDVNYDHGLNDGWLRNLTSHVAIGYYNESDLGYFGQLARQYTVADHYHASILSKTWPNRKFAHTGQTDTLDNTNSTTPLTFNTIWDSLQSASVSAVYYQDGVDYLNKFYGTKYAGITRTYSQLLSDITNNALPSVAYVDPGSDDYHPPDNIASATTWLQNTVEAIKAGPQWPHTVIIVTFDENGGFFDHVVPPRAAAPNGTDPDIVSGKSLLGFRVPAIVVSPFSTGPRVNSITYDHTSVLKMIEWRFGLTPLTARDASNDVGNLACSLDLTSAPPPTTIWADQDIGSVGAAGSSTFSDGLFTVSGSGSDIWGSSDAFHFVYQPLTGDGELLARVATVQNVAAWTKAGVMIRDTLSANSAYGLMLVSPSKGTAFQYRTSTGGTALSVAGTTDAAPMWVRIVRIGSTVGAYQSPDGNSWTLVGSATISLGATVQIGLAVSSHVNNQDATATFDSVSQWQDQDIGAVGVAGSASHVNGQFSVSGAGADIWNSADAFHFVYQPLTGDGQLIARVASVQNVAAWTKAGVMIRDTVAANAAYALMLVSPGKGTAFQYRSTTGALAMNIAGTADTAPLWVRVVRSGTTFSGYQSVDGITWNAIGSATISMGATVQIGLAVSSHDATQDATATFDSVSEWQDQDVGSVGAAGSASYGSGVFDVSGSGADIWNSADAFHFVYQPMTGDGAVAARVATVQNVSVWTKAGVMIRDTVAANASYAFMLVSPGKGSAFQYRPSTGALAASVAGTAVTAPLWVKVVRSGTTFTAYQSPDGSSWALIGNATVSMGSSVQVGLAVSSHVNTQTATATFHFVSR